MEQRLYNSRAGGLSPNLNPDNRDQAEPPPARRRRRPGGDGCIQFSTLLTKAIEPPERDAGRPVSRSVSGPVHFTKFFVYIP